MGYIEGLKEKAAKETTVIQGIEARHKTPRVPDEYELNTSRDKKTGGTSYKCRSRITC